MLSTTIAAIADAAAEADRPLADRRRFREIHREAEIAGQAVLDAHPETKGRKWQGSSRKDYEHRPEMNGIHWRIISAAIDQYDHALSTYVETEDDSALSALAPMIAQDSLALALRDGEISVEEAASGDLHKALGFEPGQALLDAADPTTMPKRDGAVAPLPQQETQVWKRTDPPMDGSQMPTGFGPAGFVAVGARTRWARNTFEPGTARYPAEPAQTF